MPGGGLHVPQRDPGIEGGHDERRSQHVRVYVAESAALADRGHPSVGRAPVESLTVPAAKNRPFVTLADDQVDGAGGAWDERDGGGLVALAGDPQGPVATLDGEVFDVRLARFAHPEPVQTEQRGQRLVHEVVVVRGGQEHAELRPIEPSSVGGVYLRAADVLGGVRTDPAVNVREPVEPRKDLEEFERTLRAVPSRYGTPLTYNSRNDVLRRLSAMFRWAHREGYTDTADYSAWVPDADGSPPLRQAVDLDALRALFAAAGRSAYPARDRAILAVFIGTGVRRGECASLAVADLQFYADGSGVARVHGKRTRANRTGERHVAFDAVTGNQLWTYIQASGLTAGPLWIGPKGPLTEQGVYKVVKRCIREAGLDVRMSGPHDLRRTFATLLARSARDQMIDGDLIRRQMGHTTYRMTSQYSLLDVEDIRGSLHSPMSMMQDGEKKKGTA